MKAAILNKLGTAPVYGDINEPDIQNEAQILVHVKAAAIHNLDKGRASGSHYANYTNLPTAVGFDGVGQLEDGTHVYAQGITGMMAEKALIDKQKYVEVPPDLDLALAAALPNATLGSVMALLFRAKLQQGEVILINGATGVTGNLAFQLAKHYGASEIIATGRNEELLGQLKVLGATKTISLKQSDDEILSQLQEINLQTPINVVVDYLWGKPTELILTALSKKSGPFAPRVRFVTVGEMAGANINLPSGILRSSGIEIMGSGIGSLSLSDLTAYNTKVLPEVFELASKGIIKMNIQKENISDIESLWSKQAEPGGKIVVQIGQG